MTDSRPKTRNGRKTASAPRPVLPALMRFTLLALALLVGCTPPPSLVQEETIPVEPLTRPLLEHEESVASIRAQAEVKIQWKGYEQHVQEAALLIPPSHLRLETLGLFGTALVLATDGEQIYYHSIVNGEFIRARATPENLYTLVGVKLLPSHLIRVLAGLPPLPPKAGTLAFLPHAARPSAPGMEGHRLQTVDGLFLQQLWLGKELSIERGELYRDGELILRFQFGGVKEVNGAHFPHLISLEQPKTDLQVEVRYLALELNSPIPLAAFSLQDPEGGKVRVLD